MNEELKKRLVGAVVLVALAVIFVPMLLDRGDDSQIPTFSSNIPAKPDNEFQTIEVPLQVPPQGAPEAQAVTDAEDAATQDEQEKTAAESSAIPAQVVPARTVTEQSPPLVSSTRSEDTASAKAPAVKPSVKPAVSTTAPSTRAAASKPAATQEKASAWVVQLGSFGKSANALSLRDRLRAKGFSAFVERLNSGGSVNYRVRVGPELKREKADALRAKLAKAGFDGVVMAHP